LTKIICCAISITRKKSIKGEKVALCNNQTIEKLVGFLRKVPADERNDVFKRAKSQLIEETKRLRELEKLFDAYIQRLRDRGCPEQILEMAQSQKSEVASRAGSMIIPERHIPFVGPVIIPKYLGYYGLMAMVRNEDREGYTHLNPSKITDEIKTPDALYWLYDVEDGEETIMGRGTQDVGLLKKQGRSPLTAAEAINLCILIDVLSRHYVGAAGSSYAGSNAAPYVCLISSGRPALCWPCVGDVALKCGLASCGSRK
jgi:hypothetical protein